MNQEEAYQLVLRQANAWENEDNEAAVADFAENGIFISPGGRWQGHDAIADAMRGFYKVSHEVTVEITRVFIHENQGAAEWTWHETRRTDGKRLSAEDAIIFQLEGDKIIYWREYFDTAEMA